MMTSGNSAKALQTQITTHFKRSLTYFHFPELFFVKVTCLSSAWTTYTSHTMIMCTPTKFCLFVCLAIVGCVCGSDEPQIETKLNVRKAAVPSVQRSLADINTSNADASFLSAFWNLGQFTKSAATTSVLH